MPRACRCAKGLRRAKCTLDEMTKPQRGLVIERFRILSLRPNLALGSNSRSLFHLCDLRFHGFDQLCKLFLAFRSCLGVYVLGYAFAAHSRREPPLAEVVVYHGDASCAGLAYCCYASLCKFIPTPFRLCRYAADPVVGHGRVARPCPESEIHQAGGMCLDTLTKMW